MNRIKTYLLLRQVKIHNANAFSSPLTIGFPAMTAWLGAMHALERKLRQHEALSGIRLKKLSVSCHDFDLQTYKGPGDYVNSVIITANPLRKKGASFERPPFIEEARVHLNVSLLIEIDGLMPGDFPIFEEKVIGHLEVRQTFKASGVGTIAGSYVLDGSIQRNATVRVSRDGEQIYEGPLASLKRFNDDAKEVKAGYECGVVLENFNDVKEGDSIEAYIMVEVPR